MAMLIQGAHRGGTTIARLLDPAQHARVVGEQLDVADPEADRSSVLALDLGRRFPLVRTRSHVAPGDAVIDATPADATLVLASDTAGGIARTLSRRAARPAAFQLVGRGPGGSDGILFGIQGVVTHDDEGAAWESRTLLDALEEIAPPASSGAITALDPLHRVTLAPLRDSVSVLTASRLATMVQDPEDRPLGPLAFLGEEDVMPLAVRPIDDLATSYVRGAALDAVGELGANRFAARGSGRVVLVALVHRPRQTILVYGVRVSSTGARTIDSRRVIDVPPVVTDPTMTSRATLTD